MNSLQKKLLLLAVLPALFFLVSYAFCTETAKLPYDTLFKLHETMRETLPKELPFNIRIYSYDPNVKIEDISIQLISNEKQITIPVSQSGIITLPIRKDLVGKGAYVVTNQPKGSMALQGEFIKQIPLKNKSIRYRDLISPLVAVNSSKKIVENVSEITGKKYMKSLNLFLEQEDRKPIIIRIESPTPVEIFPDQDGNVTIPFGSDLLQQNPIVEFPCDKVFLSKPWQ